MCNTTDICFLTCTALPYHPSYLTTITIHDPNFMYLKKFLHFDMAFK